MKKAFEFIIILLVFYGVYALFQQVVPLLWPEGFSQIIVVIAALVVAFLVIVLYAAVIKYGAKKNLQGQMKTLSDQLHQKEEELKHAFDIKRDVEHAAEESISGVDANTHSS